ncbi:MAG TPA: patatin-like phospholipase family protein [Bacteroidales bacterium]|nr:patatin-like phospholipase family protein [Bacteroidales bacterium]
MTRFLFRILCLYTLGSIILVTIPAEGQKVCLVLSGGGAKGVSHIGVIRALEENGIPIDCIAGTSMGAIVGGLYASGFSPEEMTRLFMSKDFLSWISGKMPSFYEYYFKKEDPNATWFEIDMDYEKIKSTSILPTNLISPIMMDFAIMEIFAPANAVSRGNFDSLMIPLRFVAADVEKNQSLTIREGDLATGLRAAMTFPFYFKPIRMDGKLLFDGGMYDNFPIKMAVDEFQPDVIIGSKAASNYDPPEEDDLISQLQNMLMEKTLYDVPPDKGVLIKPDLDPVNVTDFSRTSAFIDSGYVATLRRLDSIKAYIVRSIPEDSVWNRRAQFNRRKPPLVIDTIAVTGLNENQAQFVTRSLLRKRDTLTSSELRREYFKLQTDKLFEHVFPVSQYNDSRGFYKLGLDFKKEKNLTLQIGGNLSSSPINEAYFGAKFNILSSFYFGLKASVYIGRFYSAAQIDTKIELPTRMPFYLKSSISFNQWDYFETSTVFFEDRDLSYLIQNENHVDAYFGFPTGTNAKFEFGGAVARLRDDYYPTNQFTSSDTADRTYFDCFTLGALYEINTLNNKYYPNSGYDFLISLRFVGGDEEHIPGSTSNDTDFYYQRHQWWKFRAKYETYFPPVRHLTFGIYSEALLSSQMLFHDYVSSVLSASAFQPLPESKTMLLPEFRTYNYGALGARMIYAFQKNIHFRLEGYGFFPFQEIQEQPDLSAELGGLFEDQYFIASSSLVYHSPVGPVSLSMNFYDREVDRFSFIVNIGYILFNSRALQ